MAAFEILNGDCRELLRDLPEQSVQTIVTSPPYWALRDYGVDGQIGLEDSAEHYVQQLVLVFREARRVLKDDGTLWLNLGDSYAGGGNYRGVNSENTLTSKQASNRGARGVSQALGALGKDAGVAAKNLVGIPWRTAFALQADGWYLRSDIIWAKPNPMPESVTDRPTRAHEYIFLLSKSPKYYYNADAIREPFADARQGADGSTRSRQRNRGGRTDGFTKPNGIDPSQNGGKNKRSVWTVGPQPFKGAHFATFPEKLVEPCILAGSRPGDTVLDPFCGSGRTGLVALTHERDFLGLELNVDYCLLAIDALTARQQAAA